MLRRRREVLRKQARNMVYYVHCYMAKEAEEGVRNVKQIQQRTAEATQVCVSTVKQIVNEAKANEISSSVTHSKKRIKRKRVNGFDHFELGAIKRFIHSFQYNECPTVHNILPELQTKFNFLGSEKSIKRLLKGVGFQWQKTEDKKRILIEKWNIRLRRIEYLEQLKRYCLEGRTIVFSDELYLEQAQEQKAVSKSQRMVIVHAVSEAGFIPNALLVTQLYDNHSSIGSEIYHNWLQHQLIPNLPPRSVLVVDMSSPHNTELDPAPYSYAKKCDMQAWLDQKNIDYAPDLYKPQLYQLIKDTKDRIKIFTLDKMLADKNHDILRIPPHHPDLNPIEMVWSAIKAHLSNESKDFNVKKNTELVKEKIDEIGPEEWKNMRKEVIEIENCYRNNEHVIDTLSENVIVGDTDSSSESEDSDSTASSDDDDNTLPDVYHMT